MNTPSMTTKAETPSCFGKDWDKNAAECAGGPDSNFTDPKTGQHMREQCDFFHTCGIRVQAARTSRQVIPPSNLVRPPVAPQAPQTFQDFVRAAGAAGIESARQAAMSGARPPIVPAQPQWQAAQQTAPVPYQGPLNYMMPGYLTTPEERRPGESVWVVVLLEVLRGLIKGALHAGAHAVDVRRIREK